MSEPRDLLRSGRSPTPATPGSALPGLSPPPQLPRFEDGTALLVRSSASRRSASLTPRGAGSPGLPCSQRRVRGRPGGAVPRPPAGPRDRGMGPWAGRPAHGPCLGPGPSGAPLPGSWPSSADSCSATVLLHDLHDRGWIRPPVTRRRWCSRKQDGSWRICYDHRGLNATTTGASRGAAAAHRRPPGRDSGRLLIHQV